MNDEISNREQEIQIICHQIEEEVINGHTDSETIKFIINDKISNLTNIISSIHTYLKDETANTEAKVILNIQQQLNESVANMQNETSNVDQETKDSENIENESEKEIKIEQQEKSQLNNQNQADESS